jgi:dihydroneopterin aldolase
LLHCPLLFLYHYMNKIALEGMRFYAYHGFYEEERVLGGHYELDVELSGETKAVRKETVYHLCRAEMEVPSKLIEHVAQRVMARLKKHYPNPDPNKRPTLLKITLKKLSPPIKGEVARAVYECADGQPNALIGLEGMRFSLSRPTEAWGNVPVRDFLVDVHLRTNLEAAAKEDDLHKTVNYETIHILCGQEMDKDADEVEGFAKNIAQSIKAHFPKLLWLKVKVRFLLSAVEDAPAVIFAESEDDLSDTCGRCKRPMPCYKDDTCWCKARPVPGAIQAHIRETYRKCICENCLNFYTG